MLSQTVLLKGVNDDPETLAALMRAFVEARIKPYYLHHPDLAPGTSHFRMSIDEGQAIVRQLRGRLSGLAQPTYVLDIPGGHGKVPVGPGYIEEDGRVIRSGGLAAYISLGERAKAGGIPMSWYRQRVERDLDALAGGRLGQRRRRDRHQVRSRLPQVGLRRGRRFLPSSAPCCSASPS